MDISDIKDIVYPWTVAALDDAGVTVIHGKNPSGDDAGAPAPERPFVSVIVSPPLAVGVDEGRMRDKGDPLGDEIMEFKGQRETTIRFKAFADTDGEADAMIEKIRRAIHRPSLRYDLGFLSFVREAGALNSSATVGGIWEGRSQLDLTFAFTAFYTDEPGIIEKVTFEGTVADIETTTTVDLTEA